MTTTIFLPEYIRVRRILPKNAVLLKEKLASGLPVRRRFTGALVSNPTSGAGGIGFDDAFCPRL
ncbi:MAG TPA: hypothetical protein VFV81_09565 [Verrucomicrobiae bacterium]|nr:hypothetical protein [Verrucomicrobiae bacterium]